MSLRLPTRDSRLKCFWVFVLVSCVCSASARQIRYNRFNTEIVDDTLENQNTSYANENGIEIEATVQEIAPYPASGFKPLTEFLLPTEAKEIDMQTSAQEENGITTASSNDIISTTPEFAGETTTSSIIEVPNETDDNKLKEAQELLTKTENAPYPAAGFQPKIPFTLPSEGLSTNKAENRIYPAGYQPSKTAFLPPAPIKAKDNTSPETNSREDNRNHPACGSSTNPLSPKPIDGQTADPNSEPINIENNNEGDV